MISEIITYEQRTIFLTCLFRAIYSIGFMQTDILTVSVGIIETIGPIPLQIKCYSYLIIVWDEYHNVIYKNIVLMSIQC